MQFCDGRRASGGAFIVRDGRYEGPSVSIKPCTDVASNLFAIDLQLDVPIACDCLQQKFQHVEYFTCDPLILAKYHPIFQTI